MALIDLAAKMRISELYAAQYAMNFGLYQLKMLDQDSWEVLKRQFSDNLVPSRIEEPKKLSFDEVKAQQKLKEIERRLTMVKDQWSLDHKPGWREIWLTEAEKYKDQLPIPEGKTENIASEILALWSQAHIKPLTVEERK